MRITRLHIQGIRQLADLDLKPAPGLTVVRGANESGKSTIQTALEMVLFHDPTSIAPALLDLRTWGSKVDPTVRLEFEHEGRKGHLEKVFAGARGTVELSHDGRVLRDPDEVRAVIADLTGLASEEFLRSTASVRHGELEDLDQDALHDRLQRSVSGAGQGTRAAHRQLAEAVLRYRGDGGEASGRIDRTRDELERARADLVTGETALAQLERDRSALALAHDRRADLDARLARDQEQVEMGERAVRLISSANESEARYMRLRHAADLQARINTAERSHPLPMPLTELRERTHRIKELQFQIQELEVLSEMRTDGPVGSPRVVKPPRWQPVALLAMIAFAAALVVAGIGLLISAPVMGLVVAGMMFGVGVALAVVAIRMARRVRLVKAQAQMQAAEIDRRLTGKGQEDAQLREARRERDALLTVIGVPDVYAADALLERAAAHNAGVDELRAEMRGLLAGVEVSGDVIAERDRAASEMEQSRHVLSALGGAGIDPSALRETALKALHGTQVERESAIQDEGQAQGRVDQNEVDAEQVAVLAERIPGLERELADMERRVRVYDLTLETLDLAEGDTVKQAARYLEERMGDDISRITEGRYRQVRVNEQDLSFEVWSPELPGWVAVQQLSEATLDQVYLAARLGLVRQVTQDRRPPLIFDDPFVMFDTDRARRSADVLKDLAPDHQVLFLTTSDRYDTVADTVIELPAPVARDTDGPSADRLPKVLSPDPVHASTNGAATARAHDGWPAMDLTDRAPWAVAD
ncbi:MAG: AAA family ATPase [Candidatus Limnocylindrales bacterium]